ncbi:MAG: autotransporter-associated beta strand repeat-containing protein, partial [Verrucomicrobia bacterium]|nr:autotransporter-associated beta strand repeat-containing protein [Verrucomicrobiota bacterium]
VDAGATTLTLACSTNYYTGSTTLSNGILSVTTLANGGVNSSIGAASSDAANLVFAGGSLYYSPATNTSSDRSFTISGTNTATIVVSPATTNLTLTGSAPTTSGYLKKTGLGILTLDPGAGSYNVGCLSADFGSLVLKSGTFTTTGTDPSVVGYLAGAGARGGKLVVDGGTLNVTNGKRMTLAAAANGNLDILSGTVNAGDLVIGHNATCLATQSGGSVNVTNLYHIDGGNGTNTITGGTLTVKRIYNFSTVAGPYFNLILNGGIVRAAAGTVNLMDNAGLTGADLIVQLGTNGARIDTSLSDAKIVRPLNDFPGQAGTLTKIGANTLTLSSNNTYTGSTTVSNGTLRVNGVLSTGAVAVRSAATLGGSSTIGGAVTVEAGATLQPGLGGTDSSALTVANNASLAGTTLIGINRTNAATSARLVVTGTLTNGGTLTVTNVGPDVQANDAFTLFTLYAAPSGTFSATNLPALGAGTNWWATTQDTTNLVILVNQAPTAGPATYTRAAGIGIRNIAITDVLTNVTNVAVGQTVSLLSVSGTSSNGATVSINGGNIQYSPSVGSTNNDSFTYTVSDGRGGTATGNIAVNVIPVTGQDSGVITVVGNSATTVFAGIPTWVYVVQRSTNLTDWVAISTNTTPPSGLITNVDNFIDLNPPPYPSSAYYRLQSQ